MDYELEFGVIIGKTGKNIQKEDARAHIFGYTIFNDVSARDAQMAEMQASLGPGKGKDFDTGNVIGPWLVTPDEVGHVQRLDMWLDLNGKRVQTGNTRTMIFDVAKIVSYLSEFMTLMPGDVITTGTPPGVGLGMKPPLYLKKGDVMTLGIQGLGEQRQEVIAFKR
jgi:2-keto-4-pentenoate hydratase/2-oxohepta-3-ene-1,7-dioic acid hydratase in catechol pathway